MKKIGLSILFIFGLTLLFAQNTWINEIHYDNTGTDSGEFIEIIIENAETYNLNDFTVTLYTGSNGSIYDSNTIDEFTEGSIIEGFTFYYYLYSTNGIQNGSPDGIALDYQGTLIPGHFLSYEGTFEGVGGPADGVTSIDIEVEEGSTTPIGESLQLAGSGTQYSHFSWQPPAAETPGILNNNQTFGATEPEIIVISPNGGEQWEQGSTHDITWSSINFEDNVKIELSEVWRNREILISSTENDGTWEWNIPEDLLISDWYVIIISDAADGDPWDDSDTSFSIIPPSGDETITVISPNGGESWQQGTFHEISWTSVNFTGEIKIELLQDGSNPVELISATENDGSWEWEIPEDQTVAANYSIRISDTADGIPSDESDSYFSIIEPVEQPDEGVIIITEIMKNPFAVSDSDGEWFEIFNTSQEILDLNGWIIKDADTNEHIINNGGELLIQPEEYFVLGNNSDFETNGGVEVDYEYSGFTLANGDDEVILCWIEVTVVIDRVDYDDGETFPDPTGASMALDPEHMNYIDNDIGANWYTSYTAFGDGDFGTPGEANPGLLPVPGPATNPNPPNTATGVNIETDLTWTNGENTETIDLYFDENNPPTTLLLDNVPAIESYDLETLAYETQYFWKVVCRNEIGESEATVWTFTTETTGSENNEIPATKFILENYPNPFNPSGAGRSPETTISFNLTTSLRQGSAGQDENTETCPPWRIVIYNVKGQKVKTIPIITPSPAHTLSVTWDGTDDSGKPVNSGIYLYQLNVNGKTEAINKMLLLR
jgi:hypothetical protein